MCLCTINFRFKFIYFLNFVHYFFFCGYRVHELWEKRTLNNITFRLMLLLRKWNQFVYCNQFIQFELNLFTLFSFKMYKCGRAPRFIAHFPRKKNGNNNTITCRNSNPQIAFKFLISVRKTLIFVYYFFFFSFSFTATTTNGKDDGYSFSDYMVQFLCNL